MVAAALKNLGIPMGSEHFDTEDRAFVSHNGRRDLFSDPGQADGKARYLADIGNTILERNRRLDVWGWKDPIASFYIHEIYGQLRNPFYIFVTRDIGAVAQSEMVEEGGGYPNKHVLAHMYGAAEAVRSICGFLAGQDAPILLVSYERAMRDQSAFVAELADFTNARTVAASP